MDNNEVYPTPSKWCDLLLASGEINEKQLKCPANKNKNVRCSYAMNPNCNLKSSPTTVLLFETKGGWNKYGGFEILTLENHKTEGCNILFNDIHVDWITPEEIADLNWGEEKDN